MRIATLISGIFLVLATNGYSFSEVSLSSTGITSTDKKESGSDAGSSNKIQLGGRYAEPMTERVHWFGEGGLEFNSYSAPSGSKAPDNSVNLSVGGGLRLYFPDFSEAIFPFISVKGGIVQSETAEMSSGGYSLVTTSGLYYSADSGFRFDLDQDFFLDLAVDLFSAPLFGTVKSKAVNSAGATTSESETSTTAIYLDGEGSNSDLSIAIGVKL